MMAKKERRPFPAATLVWFMRAITLIIALWGGFILFFVNPINWKPYSEFTTSTWIWSWTANIGTLALALTIWWFVQRFLTRKIDANPKA